MSPCTSSGTLREWRAPTISFLPCSGRGLPSRYLSISLVVSYIKGQSPPPLHPCLCRNLPSAVYISVALSSRSPSLGVTQQPALWSPDFPQKEKPSAIVSFTLLIFLNILYPLKYSTIHLFN